MKKQSFVFSAVILAISGIFCKILGAIYKIPLSNILGSQGMGIYYLVFPIYAFFLTLTSSSFTTSISKIVSKQMADNKKLLAYKTFKASLILLIFLALIAGIFLSAFSYLIAFLQGESNAYICYLIISPSILLVAIICAFKGYFQGLQNMTPTALSQVIEQLIKLSSGFVLASLLIKKGVVFGTMGAMLGVTLSEVISCVFIIIYFFVFKKKHKTSFNFSSATIEEKQASLKPIIGQVFKTSIPFTLSSVILPLSLVIDSFLIINILKSMQFDKVFATSLLGINSGIVNTLVGLPSTLSTAICMTIVPFISFAVSKKDFEGINQKTGLAIKFTMLIAIPCVFVFCFFSAPIIKILYSSSFANNYEFNVACSLLTLSSVNVLYLAILQISTALLQSINKAYIPVISLAISLIVKVVCEIIFINIPYLNIFGAVVSNVICYFISSAINIYYFKKYVYLNSSFYRAVVCPIISSVSMCLVIKLSILILQSFIGYTLTIILSFIAGFIFYIVLIFIMRTFTKQEQSSLLNFKKVKVNSKT